MKTKKNKKQLEKENKRLGRLFLALVFFNFLFIIAAIYFSYQTPLSFIEIPRKQTNLSIEYVNMSGEEIKNFESILTGVNELYFTKNNDFKVVNGKIDAEDKFSGVNEGDGRMITIKYSSNERELKNTLCHELLHSYIYGDDKLPNDIHEIVYDLANKEACYRSYRRIG